MCKRALLWTILVTSILVISVPDSAQETALGLRVVFEAKHTISSPLRDMARPAASTAAAQMLPRLSTGLAITSSQPGPVAQAPSGSAPPISALLNFQGQSSNHPVPPDTNLSVGTAQVVQIVNVTFAVYDKKKGALLLGPSLIHTIFTALGGLCGTTDGGDPVVLFDKLAGRWFVSQLAYNSSFTDNHACIAVSTSSDATGTYNVYDFPFGSNRFPDYPKYAVWPDAYYGTFNIFGGGKARSFFGARACAFDRTRMLNGQAAITICFQQPHTITSLLPSDLEGATLPPTGAPNFMLSLADSTNLNFFTFHADFSDPSSSEFTGPMLIPVASFSEICASTLACIPEPSPGEALDAISDRLMFRLAYRNFGDHESLVVNHTVAGGALAGVRWYEIRNPSISPIVFQQGTVVHPNIDFWMGSIAMDHIGNIAAGFSASSTSLDPSVFLVGGVAGNLLGTMQGPTVAVSGTGVQEQSFNRWGDYSSMSVDPSDDCTLWYTQEYYKVSGIRNWTTRITAFRFNTCS